nr:hypothetical protein Iba_chr12bCG7580 [Ipomoea batatas]
MHVEILKKWLIFRVCYVLGDIFVAFLTSLYATECAPSSRLRPNILRQTVALLLLASANIHCRTFFAKPSLYLTFYVLSRLAIFIHGRTPRDLSERSNSSRLKL